MRITCQFNSHKIFCGSNRFPHFIVHIVGIWYLNLDLHSSKGKETVKMNSHEKQTDVETMGFQTWEEFSGIGAATSGWAMVAALKNVNDCHVEKD